MSASSGILARTDRTPGGRGLNNGGISIAHELELDEEAGKRDPYGKLGVIEDDTMVDVLIYAHSPLEDVAVVSDPETILNLFIKEGKVIENEL